MNETVMYCMWTNSYMVEDRNGAIETYVELYAESLDESLRNDPKFISALKTPICFHRRYLRSKARVKEDYNG